MENLHFQKLGRKLFCQENFRRLRLKKASVSPRSKETSIGNKLYILMSYDGIEPWTLRKKFQCSEIEETILFK